MGEYRFQHIPEDAVVLGVGSLFRKKRNKYWGINLTLSKKVERPSITITGAPLIRRFKPLSSLQNDIAKGKRLSFTIEDATQWQRKPLSECAAIQAMNSVANREQWCFEIILPDGKQLYLLQFELARVLFFHDNYLSRISLEHDVLSSDFNVLKDDEKWRIDVMPTATYSLESFNDDRCRRFLSWILIDPEARYSFDSIHRQMMQEHRVQGQYQLWDFSFQPPPLSGTRLQVTGWDDRKTNSFFVWEIRRVDYLPSAMPEEIDFHHPDFEQQVSGKGGGSYSRSAERPDEHLLNDLESASLDVNRTTLESDMVYLSFKTAFKTNRLPSKVKITPHGKPDDGQPSKASSELSPNDGDLTGTMPGAEWSIVDDQTDDAHLYENKFACFFQMIDLLETEHGCQVRRYPLRKLPKLPRCKKHMLADDANPRCMAVIEVMHKAHTCHILEVDTSDAEKPLSTIIVRLKDALRLEEQVIELEKQLLRGSLRWPKSYLDEICGGGSFSGVNHPKSKHKGRIDPADVGVWAMKFYSWFS
ncbi:Tn7-like element transposition protein TnsE [Vibrio metoecus]|uniref:Tn7-like element transposition protein TnsE n=1 Tax=Vibrio metoecus TaxID=1481663 RepID=UPI000BA98DB4|nr:Tn7-like element transposition protein TnsE [Vibrio metoecus]PAR28160.1 hypothetical protein CGU00_09715 [Vibrio metoecus]PAR60760.1 hypothetical protein CGT90_14550 [Vibrio metoecus]